MLDRRLLDGSPFYFIARQFHDVGDGGPGHVDSHVHNCDSVFLFLGSDEDYRGLEVEVLLGGQLRRLQSPASVFIPAGVEHQLPLPRRQRHLHQFRPQGRLPREPTGDYPMKQF